MNTKQAKKDQYFLIRLLIYFYTFLVIFRYSFPFLDNAFGGFTIIDLVYFFIIFFLIYNQRKIFKYLSGYWLLISSFLFLIPICYNLFSFFFSNGLSGSLIYLKLLTLPLLINLIEFSLVGKKYISEIKKLIIIFNLSLLVRVLYRFSLATLFAKSNYAVQPILAVGIILIQLSQFLDTKENHLGRYSLVTKIIFTIWAIDEGSRFALFTILVIFIFDSIRAFKKSLNNLIFKMKLRKIILINTLIFFGIVLFTLPRIFDVSLNFVSLRTRIFGIYLFWDKIKTSGLFGHGIDEKLETGVKTIRELDIATMNVLHCFILGLVITCGLISALGLVSLIINLNNKEKSLCISDDYSYFLNLRLFFSFGLLVYCMLSHPTINALIVFFSLQWILSPVKFLKNNIIK